MKKAKKMLTSRHCRKRKPAVGELTNWWIFIKEGREKVKISKFYSFSV